MDVGDAGQLRHEHDKPRERVVGAPHRSDTEVHRNVRNEPRAATNTGKPNLAIVINEERIG